jgi:hypothetical protein
MFYGRLSAVVLLSVVSALTLPSFGQSVISTRSGIVHFFDGTVYLGDQTLTPSPGKFSSVPQGGELRTAEGHAEVLLTPGAFLRMGDGSAIRMIANELSDTRVELLAGSVIVDSTEPSSGTSVTLIYKKWSVHFHEQGVYRIDCDPPRLLVLEGKAEVSAGTHDPALLVGKGMDLPLAAVLVPEKSIDQPQDALSTWAQGRQQSISADNAIAANIQDPASIDASTAGAGGGFTYFPMLGVPPASAGFYSTYGYPDPYQPGFSSIYLPGYAFLPLLLGPGRGGGGMPPVRFPFHPTPVRPIPPSPVRPIPPSPVHPLLPHPVSPHPIGTVGMHGAFHR